MTITRNIDSLAKVPGVVEIEVVDTKARRTSARTLHLLDHWLTIQISTTAGTLVKLSKFHVMVIEKYIQMYLLHNTEVKI